MHMVSQVSTDGWMDKHNVVYTYDGMLFRLKKELSKKEGNLFTCYNMVESWGCYAKWNKIVPEDRYYDSIYTKYVELSKS